MGADADEPPHLGPWDGRRQPCDEFIVVGVALFVPLFTGFLAIVIYVSGRDWPEDTVFRVAITGVISLEDDVDLPTAAAALLSPVFNLTFQIDNTCYSEYDACAPDLSRADVSYGGAFLAGGSVPPLCAGEGRSDRVAATASAENVAVPRFLWEKLLAGGASVDVKVTMPRYCHHGSCGGAVLSCSPKIGGGTSRPCRLHYV